MVVMATMPMSRPLTLEDFEVIRDVEDGRRYELIDGSLVVTPAPSFQHQRVSMQLTHMLLRTMPDTGRYELLAAPFDVRLGPATVVQPDILVITDEVPDPLPILAIEVLSPNTRHVDVGLKRSRYAAGGIQHYWVVDPGGAVDHGMAA